MTRTAHPRWFKAILPTAMATLLLAGCGETGIEPAAENKTPEFIRVRQPVDARDIALGSGSSGGGSSGGGWTSAKKRISWRQGGIVSLGRYRLIVPPYALDHDQDYEIRYETGNGDVRFELNPHGESFDVPVTIEIDMNGTDAAEYDDVTLYWYDDDDDEWVDVGGTWNPNTLLLLTPLDHFSSYGGGRAGW